MSKLNEWVSKASVEDITDVLTDPECSGKLITDIWSCLGEATDCDDPEAMKRLLSIHHAGGGRAVVDAINSGRVENHYGRPDYLVTRMDPFDEDPTIGALINKTDLCLDNKRKGFPTVFSDDGVRFVGEEVKKYHWVLTEEQAQELAKGEV